MGDQLNKLLQDHVDVRNPTDLRDYILESLDTFIENTRDFDYAEDVLDNLMDFVQSGTAPFSNIGAVKNKIDGLRSKLDDERADFDKDKIDGYNNKVAKGKIQIREILMKNLKKMILVFMNIEKLRIQKFITWSKKEAENYYNANTSNTFSTTSSIEVLTEVRKLIETGKIDEAEKFLDENKDLLSKADFLNFKDFKIPNSFFSGYDPLLKSPRFKEFMVLAEKHILNTTGQYNVGDAFNRLFDYKDEALEWLKENPLSKYNNSKLDRKKAFENFLKDQAKGLNLFQTEVEYKP